MKVIKIDSKPEGLLRLGNIGCGLFIGITTILLKPVVIDVLELSVQSYAIRIFDFCFAFLMLGIGMYFGKKEVWNRIYDFIFPKIPKEDLIKEEIFDESDPDFYSSWEIPVTVRSSAYSLELADK